MNLEQGNQVFDVVGFARRRGKLAAAVAGAVLLATYWVAMALPNLYASSATILVEPQTVDDTIVASGVRESDLNERLGLMTADILSRARLSQIIEDFKLYKDEAKRMERAELVEHMRGFVSVEPVFNQLESGSRRDRDEEFNTFRINFLHEDKKIAMNVAQRIANDFINRNIKDRTATTAKSLEFMRDKIDSLSKELAVVEKQIKDVKAESVGSLPDEMNANQSALQFATSDLRDAQRIYDAAQSDAAYWKNQALNSADLSTPNDVTSPVYRLRALELEKSSMVARGYTPKHPDMVRVDAELAVLREQMKVHAAGTEGEPISIGEQNARAEQRRAEQRAEAAAQDVARLRETIAGIEGRLAATPSVAERLDALTRNYDQLARSYQDFSDRLQKAGVQADMERRQLGEKFRILESAEEAFEPSSPNRMLLLSIGAILGLVVGFGAGLIAEVSDSSIHSSNELQLAMGIPVLASVPQIVLESDRVERARRIRREIATVAAIVSFVLLSGLGTYYFVNVYGSSTAESPEGPDGNESLAPQASLAGDSTRG